MGAFDNLSFGNLYRGAKRLFSGMPIRMETDQFSTEWINSFTIGMAGNSFYLESTDFVLLQERNFVLNNVIGKIAKKFSHASFTDQKESPLLKKINSPNKFQSKEEFLKEFSIYILSAGFTVIWKRYVSFGNFESLELININPCSISFQNENVNFNFDNKEESISLSDVILFYDNIQNHKTKKGLSRIIPLRSQLENVALAQKAKNIQISNSGTTIVSPKQVSAGSNIDEGLNAPVPYMGGGLKSQKDEMEDKLNNRGLDNRIIVSSKGLDAVNLSEKLSAIDFTKITQSDLLSICDAFGVPVELTPYGPNSTFDNKAVAELSLLENEVVPLANNLINTLNAEFVNQGVLEVNYNSLGSMSIIKARIQDTNEKTINQYKILLDSGVIDAPEFKNILIKNNILDGPK